MDTLVAVARKGFRDYLLVVFALVLSMAGSARADVLITNQGESLSGEVSRVLNGILVFKTSMSGQMMVPMTEVKALTTDSTWSVTDKAGAVHIGRFVEGGIESSAGNASVKLEPLSPADVVSAKLIPQNVGGNRAATATGAGWKAEGGVGVRAFEGTEDGLSPHLNLGLKGRGEKSEIDLSVGFDTSGDDSFPPYFRGRFEALGASERPWEPFVQAIAERDRHKALNLRTGLALGVRYSFDENDTGSLFGLVGIGGTLSQWDGGKFNSGFLADTEKTESDLNLHLELRYSRALWGRGSWDSRLYALPALTDADHFRAGAESSLVYPVTSQLQLRLDMLMSYENDPVFEDIDRVDTSLGASIQLNF